MGCQRKTTSVSLLGIIPYCEIAPPVDLAPYVDRLWLWTTVRGVPGRVHRVLPDGCVDVIVHVDRGTAKLVGTMTQAVEVPDGPAELVAVRYKPGTAAAITGCGLAEFADRSVDIADLGIADALADRVGDAEITAHARLAVLVAWLRRRLTAAEPPDPLVARAVVLLSTGAMRVEQVTRDLGVTRQYLARVFRREVGIAPKQLARIARMQRAVSAIARGDNLARLAAELGYCDQSHFSRELRDLVGLTPAAIAAERRKVPFLQSRPDVRT